MDSNDIKLTLTLHAVTWLTPFLKYKSIMLGEVLKSFELNGIYRTLEELTFTKEKEKVGKEGIL